MQRTAEQYHKNIQGSLAHADLVPRCNRMTLGLDVESFSFMGSLGIDFGSVCVPDPCKLRSIWVITRFPQAHSFPPSSLDYRSTELIVSPKKVVGCRGGSRNVEGAGDFQISNIRNGNFRSSKFQFHISCF